VAEEQGIDPAKVEATWDIDDPICTTPTGAVPRTLVL